MRINLEALAQLPPVETFVRKQQVRSVIREINQLAEGLGYRPQTEREMVLALTEQIKDSNDALREKIAELRGGSNPRLATKATVRSQKKPLSGASEIVVDLGNDKNAKEEIRFKQALESKQETIFLNRIKHTVVKEKMFSEVQSYIISISPLSLTAKESYIFAPVMSVGDSPIKGKGWNKVLEELVVVKDFLASYNL